MSICSVVKTGHDQTVALAGRRIYLYQKRLEDGTFELPRFNPREDWNKIEWKTFMMIMSGISLNSVKYRKRLRL